jgi:ABC-type branched-subunit amino acid transport system permease subunit
MSIFDPYDRSQPVTPGLNTGSQTQVSTLDAVPTGELRAGRYRSGALSALAPMLGYLTLLVSLLAGTGSLAAAELCRRDRLSAPACDAEPTQLVLVPLAMLVVGLVAATIGGSLTKRRKAASALVVLAGGALAVWSLVSWFTGSVLGLPLF